MIISNIFAWLLLCKNVRAAATRKNAIKLVEDISGARYKMEEVTDLYKANIEK